MPELSNLISMLYAVHRDSSRLQHFARDSSDNSERSTMPVTAFVYEYFLYNNLYSIDWNESQGERSVIYHPLDKSESSKQQSLEDYFRPIANENPHLVANSFKVLIPIPFKGPWRQVNPDPYISIKDGDAFFKALEDLIEFIKLPEGDLKQKMGKVFSRIQSGRLFVYKVRNNIFHGTKSLGEVWDPDQSMRINVYYHFLKGLNRMFFRLWESSNKVAT